MLCHDVIVPVTMAIALGVFGAGCVRDNPDEVLPIGDDGSSRGENTTGGSGSCGTEGRGYFEANVLPFVDDGTTGNACAQCHLESYGKPGAPWFLGSSRAGIYDALASNKKHVSSSLENSLFLNKGVHSGPALTPEQHEKVAKWLEIEAAERFGDCTDEPKPPSNCKTGKEMIAEFGACMTLEDWTTTGMHLISTQNVLNGGPCYSCHALGTGGNYMTDPEEEGGISLGFEKMRILSPILNLVTWTPGDDGACPDLVPANRWIDKSGQGGHPKYLLDPAHINALDTWFKLTYDKWKNGTCALP